MASRARAVRRALARVAWGLLLAFAATLLALLATTYDRLEFGFGVGLPRPLLPMAALVALGVLLAAGVALLARRASGAAACRAVAAPRTSRGRGAHAGASGRVPFWAAACLASVVVFALQVALVSSLYGHPGWDAGTLADRAVYLAGGAGRDELYGPSGDAWVLGYYETYPNNALLTVLLSWAARLGLALGADPLLSCALAGALSANVGGLCSALFVRRVSGSAAAAWAGLALYTVLFSLSPWVSVPYSDTYAAGFVGAGLLLGARALGTVGDAPAARADAGRGRTSLARSALARLGRWLPCAVVCLLGFLVKPTAAIVLIAVVLAWLAWLPGRAAGSRLPDALGLAAALGLALALALGVVAPASYRALGIDGRSDQALGMAHFFMMGQNAERTGAYLEEDVAFSSSIADPAERSRADVARGLGRMAERGVVGEAAFLARKMLFSFGDASWSWSADGGPRFLTQVYPAPGGLAEALRSLFYRAEWQAGASQAAFRTWAQVCWLAVVALWGVAAVAGLLGARRPETGPLLGPAPLVPALALLGMLLYLLLFEDRARYLYCFGPVSVACAALGVAGVAQWRRGA